MVGQVRIHMRDRILGIGVVKIHICVDRIVKGTGDAVLYYSVKIIIKKYTPPLTSILYCTFFDMKSFP